MTTPDVTRFGTGDALATLADEFGQLAVSLADGADQPFTSNGWSSSRSAGSPGLSTPL